MKLAKLTSAEIAELASKKGVKKIAVENFLSTMGDNLEQAMDNLFLDLSLYKWSHQTFKAIYQGIKLAHNKYLLKRD